MSGSRRNLESLTQLRQKQGACPLFMRLVGALPSEILYTLLVSHCRMGSMNDEQSPQKQSPQTSKPHCQAYPKPTIGGSESITVADGGIQVLRNRDV